MAGNTHRECLMNSVQLLLFPDPAFYPTSVSVWPVDASTLLVRWEFDGSRSRGFTEDSDLSVAEFQIQVSSKKCTNRTISSISPLERR